MQYGGGGAENIRHTLGPEVTAVLISVLKLRNKLGCQTGYYRGDNIGLDSVFKIDNVFNLIVF